MIYTGQLFKNRKFDIEKLLKYGFSVKNIGYVFEKNILDNEFKVVVSIIDEFTIDTKVVENATGEEYGLVYVKDVQGTFVGKVKDEFEKILIDIKEGCTVLNIFKSFEANAVIDYIYKKYGDKPEYLWEKFPNNAIFRRSDKKGKWYAVILTVKREKLGLSGVGEVEIIDLKALPEVIDKVVDNKRYFRGYHMNKKHWYTICFDGSVDIKEIEKRIDESYLSI